MNGYFVDGDAVTNRLKLKAYGVDLVGDVLNLGIVEVLSSIGYGYYDADISNRVNINGYVSRKNFNEKGNGVRLGLGLRSTRCRRSESGQCFAIR